MNVALLIASGVGLTFTVFALRHPHWPNGNALIVLWQAICLTRCPHAAWNWTIERCSDGRFLIHCRACERHRKRQTLAMAR